MGLYDQFAGGLDHLAGSTDEATGRFLDESESVAESDLGPAQRATGYTRLFVRHTLGSDTENLAFETPNGSFAGQEDDTSVFGPSLWGEGSLVDAAVDREGETSSAREWRSKIWLYGIILLVVLYVVGPILGPIVDAALGGDAGA